MSRPITSGVWRILGLVAGIGLGCTVPEEVKVSLYDQGYELHGGPAAYQAAQQVVNDLELREFRHEWVDPDGLHIETRCRQGIFLEESSGLPDGFVSVTSDSNGGHLETCDEHGATEARKTAGIRWTQAMLPYESDIAAQRAQASYAREYAAVSRRLGIEADEWEVPNKLDTCIQDRIAELSAHHANVAELACEGYRDPSSLEVDFLRELMGSTAASAEKLLADTARTPPVVPETIWAPDKINGTQEPAVETFPTDLKLTLNGTVGIPLTLVRGETFSARLVKEEGYVLFLRLWTAEGGNVVASDMAMETWSTPVMVTWKPARTQTYVLAVSAFEGPHDVQLFLDTDEAGTLPEPRRQELEQLVRRAGGISKSGTDAAPLLEMLRWQNEGAHDACVEAALFSIPAYARNRSVEDALSECGGELTHRIETRERVLKLGKEEKAEDE